MPLGAIVAFVLFSLFSLGPLADGYAKIPIVSDAIQWVHGGSTNWSLLISDYVVIARQAANSAGIPPNYFVLQIRQESNFNPNAVSPAGAVGIAQFLPSTAATLGVNPYDPISSLYGAARYMASLDKSCSGDYAKALAAYNAGPPAVTRAVNSGGANWLAYMPAETQNYVHTIMG
jgi:soluble lytic murein transglycosylase-like protein